MTERSPVARVAPVVDPTQVGPGSVSWKVHREVALLLGWARAILLQLAHPLVARGVGDHSTFRVGRFARWRRLHRTLSAMLAMTFGPPGDTERAIAGINAIHDRVHGRLPADAGPFRAGASYSAHDPALLTWVHATCVESFLMAYELFVAPLTADERDRYCEEASWIEPMLGIPVGALPRSMAELDAYMAGMYASGDLVVTDTARTLAREVISPPAPWPLRPFVLLMQLPAVGLLPPPIREAYGLSWGPRRERFLRRSAAVLRRVHVVLPGIVRHWPRARAAFRAQRSGSAALKSHA
jgi:uncharacterized protein (DUF2236 family)